MNSRQIEMKADRFIPVHTQISDAVIDGTPALRVVKKDKIDVPDENTYAKLKDLCFHNGVIEIKMRSRLLPDAPAHARGFIGIVFRANDTDSEFESFYVRPTNGRLCEDPVRKAHGCQYFSYPGYIFSYFREFGITEFEAPVDVALDEWITLKAVVENDHAAFYLNGAEQPVLTVNHMKHGPDARGAVGIFVDIGTEAFVSSMQVTCTDS